MDEPEITVPNMLLWGL